MEHADLEGWLKKHLCSIDHVVIESTTNAWHVYDLLAPLVERVVVANPIRVKQIAQARVKTDIRDTLILARLLAANLVPDVWVPPVHVRELRQLLSQRRQFVETHTPYPVKTSPQGFYSRKPATTVRSAGIGRMEPSLNLEHKTRWVGSSSRTFSRPF